MSAGGKLMARLRHDRSNMTLEALGAIVGVSASALSQWETGDTKLPRRHHVEATDRALNAGGALLAAYGYGIAESADVDVLRSEVHALRDLVDGLTRRVQALEATERGDG